MYALAVESSWVKGSVSLLEDDTSLEQRHLQEPHSHGRNLAPTVMSLLKDHSIALDDLDVLFVDVGPGSYTGLRVGVSFVKTLAYAEGLPVTTVTSCEAIASRAPVQSESLCVLIDAQWNEFYVAFYRAENESWVRSSDIQTATPEEVAERLDEDTMLLGNGIPIFRDQVNGFEAESGPESYWQPRADVVGRIGYSSYRDGHEADLYSLQPLYLRPTQADVDRN